MIFSLMQAQRAGRILILTCFAVLVICYGPPAAAQAESQLVSANVGDWPLHNQDLFNSRYSELDQINRTNVSELALRWTYSLPTGSTAGSATPLVVAGVMYFNSGSTLFALDAETGESLWTTTVSPEFRGGGRGPVFADGKIYAMGRSAIFAVDAKTGEPVESFGSGGVVWVVKNALDFKDPDMYPSDFDPESIGYALQAPPTYVDGTLYLGTAVADSLIPGGLIMAVDAARGRIKWVFRTVPQSPKDDGWELAGDTWSGPLRQGGSIWTQPAIDPQVGLLYANVSNPTPNYDGSSRTGMNLFTNCIIALRLDTGRLVWHSQVIHHDIWDWDLMTGPTLFDMWVSGRTVKALGSLAKSCYVYVLDRETGEPVFPFVETPVPTTTDMPGEEVWPTQPIPYTVRNVPQQPFCATYPEVSDPQLAQRRRPSFHPYQVNEFVIVSPGLLGGPNRGASSYSPRTGLLYVTGKNDAWSIKVKPVGTSINPAPGSPGHFENISEEGETGVEATQNIAAFNPATGELLWVVRFAGVTNGGNVATAGDVLFQGIGRDLYAIDATSGEQLTKVEMPVEVRSTPMTYEAAGTQFVAIASGGTVLAFALP